jgi:hypothetical protein
MWADHSIYGAKDVSWLADPQCHVICWLQGTFPDIWNIVALGDVQVSTTRSKEQPINSFVVAFVARQAEAHSEKDVFRPVVVRQVLNRPECLLDMAISGADLYTRLLRGTTHDIAIAVI